MFLDGVDQGYRSDPRWWWEGPDAFRMEDLDQDYPPEYFKLAEPPKAKEMCQLVKEFYEKTTGKTLRYVADFGCGGGWNLQAFKEMGIVTQGYDGSMNAIVACRIRGHFPELADFRKHIPLGGTYDIIVCTEVAEHLAIPFHGRLISHLIERSNLVWWSSEPPDTNQSHLHHPGEMPLQYWIKLFAFFGYGCHMLPDEIMQATENRGRCVFFNKNIYQL